MSEDHGLNKGGSVDLTEIKRQLKHLETTATALYHINGEDFAYFRPHDVQNLIAEVERLTGLEPLWKSQNDLNAEENKELRDKNFKFINQIEMLTRERDRYKSGLERIRDEYPLPLSSAKYIARDSLAMRP